MLRACTQHCQDFMARWSLCFSLCLPKKEAQLESSVSCSWDGTMNGRYTCCLPEISSSMLQFAVGFVITPSCRGGRSRPKMGCRPSQSKTTQRSKCQSVRPARPLQLFGQQGLYNARPPRIQPKMGCGPSKKQHNAKKQAASPYVRSKRAQMGTPTSQSTS